MAELKQPIFRFKFVKKKILNGPNGSWSRYERHWKHQVAYTTTSENLPNWQNIPDEYFMEDVFGNQSEINLEEYKND